MAQKPSIPKGTRDFLPNEMVRRNHIFDVIKQAFQRYGYLPVETPAMEKRDTLMGKYGEEGDRLIFQIMPRGRKLDKAIENPENIRTSAEEALRYDLTVPFARYVVQHQNDISFPFKRYQIQPVWRADRPQKGRYREFYQCDADVIGSDSLLNEVELVMLMDDVFSELDFSTSIKINNRKILSGIAEVAGAPEKMMDITVAIDKLDKIGKDGVKEELQSRGIPDDAINKIEPLFGIDGSINDRLSKLESILGTSEIGNKGIEELRYVIDHVLELGLKKSDLEIDVTLARGLDYYTGAIFEVKANEGDLNVSICGGGRYDDLTGVFGLKGVSGVGISFGADRIYDVLNDLDRYPDFSSVTTRIMFVNFGPEEENQCLKQAMVLRQKGVNAEVYPGQAKMKKQMKYANDKRIPFVAIIGSEELKNNTVTLKEMETGAQQTLSTGELINRLT